MKANRAYRLIVTRGGRTPALLADTSRVDHIEVVEVDAGEVVLFWDRPPQAASRLARALGYRGALMAWLPETETASEWLQTMTLIRRFEERAGEMYARAKIGGFLHLSIGEEATIVGSARARREDDYLI